MASLRADSIRLASVQARMIRTEVRKRKAFRLLPREQNFLKASAVPFYAHLGHSGGLIPLERVDDVERVQFCEGYPLRDPVPIAPERAPRTRRAARSTRGDGPGNHIPYTPTSMYMSRMNFVWLPTLRHAAKVRLVQYHDVAPISSRSVGNVVERVRVRTGPAVLAPIERGDRVHVLGA